MVKANLIDINKAKVTRATIINSLYIIYKVIEKEFKKIIKWLSKNKAPGPDSITNKVIYIVAPIVLKKLV